MNPLRLLSRESLSALRAAKGTPAFGEARMSAWQSHKDVPGFPGWETFKRLLDALLHNPSDVTRNDWFFR